MTTGYSKATMDTMLGTYVPVTRTVNGKALSSNISLTSNDVAAVPTSRLINGHAMTADVNVTAADVGAAPYLLASGASGIRFIGSGTALPATASTGDVFLLVS